MRWIYIYTPWQSTIIVTIDLYWLILLIINVTSKKKIALSIAFNIVVWDDYIHCKSSLMRLTSLEISDRAWTDLTLVWQLHTCLWVLVQVKPTISVCVPVCNSAPCPILKKRNVCGWLFSDTTRRRHWHGLGALGISLVSYAEGPILAHSQTIEDAVRPSAWFSVHSALGLNTDCNSYPYLQCSLHL